MRTMTILAFDAPKSTADRDGDTCDAKDVGFEFESDVQEDVKPDPGPAQGESDAEATATVRDEAFEDPETTVNAAENAA